jgi:hypothetical protein
MILLAFVLALVAANPQTDLGDHQAERIAKLAQELESPDPPTRERATGEFVVMGRPALKALKALEKSASDPEVRSRASAATREIHDDLRWGALKFEVSTDRRIYEPGGTITVSLRLKNVEDFPVTIYLGDGMVQTNAGAEVVSGAKPVQIVVPTYQLLLSVPITVDEKRFRTIEPGGSIEAHALSFKERWDLGKKDPGLKASYTEESRRPLEAGTYQVKAGFSYGFKSKKQKREALLRAKEKEAEGSMEKHVVGGYQIFNFKLTPKAEQLMAEVWEGSLEGLVDFQVAGK